MSMINDLLTAPPYAVESTLKQLGANLRTARLRRKLTIEEVAARIGTGYRAVANAEKGHPTTGIAVYIALLWVYNLLPQMHAVADPSNDIEGETLALSREPIRTRHRREKDDDF